MDVASDVAAEASKSCWTSLLEIVESKNPLQLMDFP